MEGQPGGQPPDRRDAKAQAAADKAYAKSRRPWWKKKRFIIPLGLVLIAIIASAGSGGGGDDESDSGNRDGGNKTEEASGGGSGGSGSEEEACGTGEPEKPNNASDDCTPHVGPSKKVTVDGVVYAITNLDQRDSIGDASIGFDEKASGTYLVLSLTAHSTKGETVQLSDDTFKVTCDGCPEYSADSDGTFAAVGEGGEDPFLLTDIQPDSTEKGRVVFDVPKKLLKKKLELRVNELGFGESHGFIQLPL